MKRIFKFCIIATILCININSCYSNTRDDCGSTLIIDGSTHVTLQSKNANKIIEPASFAKLMTIAVVLDFLHDNKINLKQEVEITHDIWIKGGAPSGSSSMFTALNSKVSVENLLKGLIIDSANDAALALAKLIAGDETNFAKLMNNEAKRIGLKNSFYVNATGLPQEGLQQKTTLEDSMLLMYYLKEHYPLYAAISKQSTFGWSNITQLNKNFLLKKNNNKIIGLCGITAYNKIDHFMFLGCAQKNNRIVYIAFTDAYNKNNRIARALNLLNWAYTNFVFHMIVSKNTAILKIPVFAGISKEATVVAANSIYGLEDIKGEQLTHLKVRYKTPLIAPIHKNDIVGTIAVYSRGELKSTGFLISNETIKATSFVKKFKAALYQITIGWFVNLVYYRFSNI